MTTTPILQAISAPWARKGKTVVVGVDGSAHNHAAILWAADRAAATGRGLDLVGVLSPLVLEASRRSEHVLEDAEWDVLEKASADVTGLHPGLSVRTIVSTGGSVSCLLARSAEQAMLVVGRRGWSTFERLLLGSTAVDVAGESSVPVAVVPDDWKETEHEGQPLVVGINPFEAHADALTAAFTEARRRGAEVLVTYGFEVPARVWWDPALPPPAYDELAQRARDLVDAAVADCRDHYPEVPARVVFQNGHPSDVVLHAAQGAQLVVVGRRHGHFGGFTLGSVARAVLHHAHLPVLVVPSTGTSDA